MNADFAEISLAQAEERNAQIARFDSEFQAPPIIDWIEWNQSAVEEFARYTLQSQYVYRPKSNQ